MKVGGSNISSTKFSSSISPTIVNPLAVTSAESGNDNKMTIQREKWEERTTSEPLSHAATDAVEGKCFTN